MRAHENAPALAAEFLKIAPADFWRPAFDQWALSRGLSMELRRAVVVAILRERVFNATARYARRTERAPR